jgi:hypothetical protein
VYIFEVLGRDAAVLLEDDPVLGPRYLEAIADLLPPAAEEAKIGYVSASGDLSASLRKQWKLVDQLIPMHETWGAALTRASWLAQRQVRERYWERVKEAELEPARSRGHPRPAPGMGCRRQITSQDAPR